jgi:copper transport protein
MALRRAWRAAAVAIGLVLAVRSVAHAHATLIRATPAAGAVLLSPPETVRLLFDEPLDISVSRVAVVDAGGRDHTVSVALDPHDVHALITRLPTLADGAYRVEWSTVSADGHAVSGSYVFRVGREAARAPAPPTSRSAGPRPARPGAIATAVGFRAVGDLLVAVTGGLLLFGVLFGLWPRQAKRARTAVVATAVLTPIALAAHDVAWASSSAPSGIAAGVWMHAMLGTGQGELELVRLVLALLVVWALVLLRRDVVALSLSALLLCCTGGVGHALVMYPGLALPLKAAHCLAMAAWIGGLCWILLREGGADGVFLREVQQVSSVALIAVLIIATSGLGMAATFLPMTRPSLLASRYALLLALKVLGLLVLAAFGWINRQHRMPRLAADGASLPLRRSVRYEVVVMLVVFALGAWLSYTSPHGS